MTRRPLSGKSRDEQTPSRISAGISQLPISTARGIMKTPKIDRAWLFDPNNSIRACGAYIKSNHDHLGTGWDPISAACDYAHWPGNWPSGRGAGPER
jgi:hypothetical protein